MVPTALLLIDVTNEVLHADGTLGGDLRAAAENVIPAVGRLVGWARRSDVPVIWARTAFRPGYIDASAAMRRTATTLNGRLLEGTWGTEIVQAAGYASDDIVITKKRPSAFLGTELHYVLRGLAIGRLLIAGTSTNWAVESTARDADSYDYEVVVARDATAARMAQFHEPALRSIGSRYARVASVQDIVQETR